MSRMNVRVCVLATILGALAACGGGGGTAGPSAASPPVAQNAARPPELLCAAAVGSTTGGIEGTGIGPATKLKNLIVAGHAWDISHASVMIDGQPMTTAQIVDGLVTIVQGTTAATGTGMADSADSVVSETRVAGPITSADAAGTHLVVLGQNVILTQQMAASSALAVGDIAEVSALATADGILIATRIAPRAANLEYFVTGMVKSHDDATRRLLINGLTVDYSSAVPQGFPLGVIHDGDLVRVFGRLPVGSLTLNARAVEFRLATLSGPVGEQVGLEGFVTRFTSSADFDVDGVPITTSAATDFQPADVLALSDRVTLCGALGSTGKVAATRVIISTYTLPNIAGTIQSVDATTGVLKILGLSVTTDAATRVQDARTNALQPLALSDLHAGDFVRAYGTTWSTGSIVLASLIRRQTPSAFIVAHVHEHRLPPGVAVDDQTRYFGSCSAALHIIGLAQSPAQGPCSAGEFWQDFYTWAGPLIPSLTVMGAVRQSDGVLLASAVVVSWD